MKTQKRVKTTMKEKLYIALTLYFNKNEDGRWVAECKELDISTYATTFDEAKYEMNEAVITYLNTLEDVGERERFFKERGIKVFNTPSHEIKITADIEKDVIINPFIHQMAGIS